jgi:exonuclease SbcD
MRILHTSDWHIGKSLRSIDRRVDHEKVTAEIVDIARKDRPHLIIHSGDLFDTPYPAVDAMKFGLDVVRELAAIAPVVVLRGNHDSEPLFEVFASLVGDGSRLVFVPRARVDEKAIIEIPVTQTGELARVATLPFVHNSRYIAKFDDPNMYGAVYAERMRQIQRVLRDLLANDRSDHDVLLFTAHMFVQGAKPSWTEREVDIADDYGTKAADIPPIVSYAAFGHIHKPQQIEHAGVLARYAGSIVQMDFGERGEAKSVVMVEAKAGAAAHILAEYQLSAGRQLVEVRGTLEEITRDAHLYRDKICKVVVSVDDVVPDLRAQVGRILAGAAIYDVSADNPAWRAQIREATQAPPPQLSIDDLFGEFLQADPPRRSNPEMIRKTFATIRTAYERQEPPLFSELVEDEVSG